MCRLPRQQIQPQRAEQQPSHTQARASQPDGPARSQQWQHQHRRGQRQHLHANGGDALAMHAQQLQRQDHQQHHVAEAGCHRQQLHTDECPLCEQRKIEQRRRLPALDQHERCRQQHGRQQCPSHPRCVQAEFAQPQQRQCQHAQCQAESQHARYVQLRSLPAALRQHAGCQRARQQSQYTSGRKHASPAQRLKQYACK
ncbi:hypothetical protein D3C81_1254400 [compost metagenome]